MGIGQSKSSDLKEINTSTYEKIQRLLVEACGKNQIDQRMFTHFLFDKLDESPHPILGKMVVSNTFILEQFFLVLTNQNKDAKLNPSKFKSEIEKMYRNPEKAIQYSFRLMDLDDDKKITKAQFLSYIDNCFTSLQFAAQKKIHDQQFAMNFKNWVKTNKKVLFQSILQIFDANAKSNPEYWLLGDFTRWVRDKNHWTLDIQIGAQKLRTPINLLCLLRIQI